MGTTLGSDRRLRDGRGAVSTATARRAMPAADYQINVVDGCLPARALEAVQEFVLRAPWHYGWKSDAKRDLFSYWHIHLAGSLQGPDLDHPETLRYCEDELAGAPHFAPVWTLWQTVHDKYLPGHRVIRAYLNGHTYGTEGSIHVDTRYPDQYTVMLYAHAAWSTDWAGETVFLDPERTDIVAAVHPKPGRLVYFDGRIPHVARGVTRICPALRTVVVFKTQRAG
jgi:SM-20-related protein